MASYTYATDPSAVVTDPLGNVLPGRQLRVYTARNGTRINELLDMSGLPIGNTLTTDSDGRYPFKIDPQTYPVVWIRDPDDGWWFTVANEVLEGVPKAIADAAAALSAVQAMGSSQINVRTYGAVGDGVTDDSPAFEAAIADAPPGAMITVPASPSGQPYFITRSITNVVNGVPKSVHFTAYGAQFLKSGDFDTVVFRSDFEGVVPVTALALGNLSENEGDSIVKTIELTITGPTPSWRRGDLVKLIADDAIPYSTNGGTAATNWERSGQHFTVISVSGNQVVLAGRPAFPFTTNIRVAKMNPIQCTWHGGAFDITQEHIAAGYMCRTFDFSAAYNPIVRDVISLRATSAVVRTYGCFGAVVENVRGGWAYNHPTGSQGYGYGVADTGSQGTSLTNCYFHQVRHAYSGGASQIAAGHANPQIYGGSYQVRVSHSYADSCTSTAWDTHPAQLDVIFDDVHAANCTNGFGQRSPNVTMTNVSTRNCGNGIRLFDSGGNSEVPSNLIDGYRSEMDDNVLDVVFGQREGSAMYHIQQLKPTVIRNLYARLPGSGRGMSLRWGYFQVDNLTLNVIGALSASVVALVSANVRGSDWDIYYTEATGTAPSAVLVADEGTASVMTVDGIRLHGTIASRLTKVFDHPSNFAPRIDNLFMANLPPQGVHGSFSVGGYIDWQQGASFSADSGFLTIDNTTNFVLMTRRDPTVLATITTADRTYGVLPNAGKLGQELTIVNNTTSTNNLIIQDGASFKTKLKVPGNKTLAPGQSMKLKAITSAIWLEV